MCGRYAMSIDAGNIANAIEEFNLKVTDVVDKDKQNPSYNVCPTRFAPTYRTNKDNQAIVQYMSWGLIPFWTKKKADANQYKTFNARKESVINGQRLWTPVRKHHRCAVPIEGYYEWQHKKVGQTKKVDKIPYFLKRKDGKLMFLAGLYDTVDFEDTEGSFDSFTIITGPAPKQTKWLHERMPIVLTPGTKEWDAWLDNETEWNDTLADSLAEYAKDDLEWYEVTKDVGKVTNEGKYLIKPLKKGGIGDFFGKGKKEQLKGESKDFKEEKDLKEGKKEEPDVTDLLKTEGETDEVKKEDDSVKNEESEKKNAKKEDEKEETNHQEHKESNTDENTSSKRSAEDESTISGRLRHDHKKPKVES